MLYLSTRNKTDSFTAHRVLHSEHAPDGGMFLPMQIPVFDDFLLSDYEHMSFNEAIASILNLFFGTKLSAWDVDFAVGRQAVELVSCGYKAFLAESWHNPAGAHADFVNRLFCLVTGEKNIKQAPNAWFCTAVDIAILFGVYGKYCRQEIYTFDIAVDASDLLLLFAVRYAQKMGLTVGNISLGTSGEDCLWELFSLGEYQPNEKHIPPGLECLLWLEFGYGEVNRVLDCISRKATYRIKQLELEGFRQGIFSTVVSNKRIQRIIDNTLLNGNFLMDKVTAGAFGALQDYRAKTGESKNTLLFARSGRTL